MRCPRCQHVNVCPPAAAAVPVRRARPIAAPAPALPRRDGASGLLWTVVVLLLVAVAAWAIWSALSEPRARAATVSTNPLDALEDELIQRNLGRRGDPNLDVRYMEINAQHFSRSLPPIPVCWEPRLAEASKLSTRAFTLEGLFGHLGGQSVILLNPDLQSDPRALARALSHEMVHAYLFAAGNAGADHGPAFQAVLRRLAGEGAFEGTPATDEERAELRAWLDAESARLDDEHTAMDRLAEELTHERSDLESAIADVTARGGGTPAQDGPASSEIASVMARRSAYNQRAEAANDRSARDRADLAHFNDEVARYNLMLAYPDGLDEASIRTPKTPPSTQPAASAGTSR